MSCFGKVFRVTTFGESHGGGVGCIVEGVPPCMHLVASDIQGQLSRRRPGQSKLGTDRQEGDKVEILSGTENSLTLGSPIAMLVRNNDHRPMDYSEMSQVPRPSHADYTYMAKYGINASSGGGRASARETIGRVAAGAVAEKWLREKFQIEIIAWVRSVGPLEMSAEMGPPASRQEVDSNEVRCPDQEAAESMKELILKLKSEQDSTGGVVACVVRGVPAGWGEPCFDKLEALLAHAMLSIPSTKGFEFGSGFAGTKMTGSQHNDAFESNGRGGLQTATNRSGGVQGGISNGANLDFAVAFKPPATIARAQSTADYSGTPASLEARGRHDPCVVPRAVPIVEAMAALVLADLALQQLARQASASGYEKIINVL